VIEDVGGEVVFCSETSVYRLPSRRIVPAPEKQEKRSVFMRKVFYSTRLSSCEATNDFVLKCWVCLKKFKVLLCLFLYGIKQLLHSCLVISQTVNFCFKLDCFMSEIQICTHGTDK